MVPYANCKTFCFIKGFGSRCSIRSLLGFDFFFISLTTYLCSFFIKGFCFSCRSCCGKCAFLILRRRRCCCFGRDIVFNITDAETGENCGDLAKLWAGPLGIAIFSLKTKMTNDYIVVLLVKISCKLFYLG